ncbi:MAG: DUF3887 domain-containing protein [Candidatus Marinimicrobia bacterium]|nr:DUF3887 domain-containing protein [Candidatus Neomarinimicrobiota bacterium]
MKTKMNFTITLKNALVLLLILVLLAGCDSKYSKLDEADVNREQKSLAEDIAVKLMTVMKTGDYYQLGDEATRMMQRGLTQEVQEEAYESIKGQFGDFISLKYAETCKPTDGSYSVIYRFTGDFESGKPIEIRVVMDGNNKLSGFWIKPWKKKLG